MILVLLTFLVVIFLLLKRKQEKQTQQRIDIFALKAEQLTIRLKKSADRLNNIIISSAEK
jgi:hypothetical protein